MKKVKGVVVDGRENGGFHKLSAYRSAEKMIREHGYVAPRLYHLCFIGSSMKEPYLAAIKALMEHLRKHDIPCEYRGALEEKAGNLHLHVFLLLDSVNRDADRQKFINRSPDGWLMTMCLTKGIDCHLNGPQHPMHGKKNYASVPHSKPEKVNDCCLWIQYIYKSRDKPASGQVYFSSRPSRRIKPAVEEVEAA